MKILINIIVLSVVYQTVYYLITLKSIRNKMNDNSVYSAGISALRMGINLWNTLTVYTKICITPMLILIYIISCPLMTANSVYRFIKSGIDFFTKTNEELEQKKIDKREEILRTHSHMMKLAEKTGAKQLLDSEDDNIQK